MSKRALILESPNLFSFKILIYDDLMEYFLFVDIK